MHISVCVSFSPILLSGGFLSQRKQQHLVYGHTERFMVVDVVKCVTQKMLVHGHTFLLGLQGILKNCSVRSLRRSYKKVSAILNEE